MTQQLWPYPSDAELAILRVLWRRGPSTVREVWEHVERAQPTGYTTVLKFLQIMAEKGLVTRDVSSKAHIYEAAVSEEVVQRNLLGDLLNRAFSGSAAKLVMRALTDNPSSNDELSEIRELIDKLEERS